MNTHLAGGGQAAGARRWRRPKAGDSFALAPEAGIDDGVAVITKLSKKGQVLVPAPIRKRLGLTPGTELEVEVAGDHLVLVPRPRRRGRFVAARDEVSGLPTLAAARDPSAPLTSQQVAQLQADFP